MDWQRQLAMVTICGMLASQVGCTSCRSACNSCGRGPVARAVPPGPLPPRYVPPAAVPPATYVPPVSVPGTPAPLAPADAPPSVQGSYSIPIPPEPNWKPSTAPGVRLAPPESAVAESPRTPSAGKDSAQLNPPSTPEPPIASVPSPPAREPMGGTPALPVDIPQFALARPRVAAGQQPFPDGVAWLQSNGYRTVLHVHKPGEDVAAARRQFEKYGLKYVSLAVSPQTLQKDVVDQFNRLVNDEGNLPLFVYDRDGSLAGGLWYLHFRQGQGADDNRARSEAARLGFKEDRDDEHRTMWLAIQNYLKTLMPPAE